MNMSFCACRLMSRVEGRWRGRSRPRNCRGCRARRSMPHGRPASLQTWVMSPRKRERTCWFFLHFQIVPWTFLPNLSRFEIWSNVLVWATTSCWHHVPCSVICHASISHSFISHSSLHQPSISHSSVIHHFISHSSIHSHSSMTVTHHFIIHYSSSWFCSRDSHHVVNILMIIDM